MDNNDILLKVLEKVNSMDARFDQLENRIDKMEARLDARIDGLDARIDGLERKMEARFAGMESRFDTMEKQNSKEHREIIELMQTAMEDMENRFTNKVAPLF